MSEQPHYLKCKLCGAIREGLFGENMEEDMLTHLKVKHDDEVLKTFVETVFKEQ